VNFRRPSTLIYNFRHYFGLGAELGHTFRSQTPYPDTSTPVPGPERPAARTAASSSSSSSGGITALAVSR
jgi:hypothetical protein